jgi:hypothetical protein
MFKKTVLGLVVMAAVIALTAAVFAYGSRRTASATEAVDAVVFEPVAVTNGGFSVEVLIEGMPAAEYAARGRRYIEALENAEYQLRIHNPSSSRVAVALSVDGLNTIDARHTSAWAARKWVIEPYGTIHVRGWQMSAANARRFYFTTERDSYAAKLGQAANVGLISAVFFRERQAVTVMPVTPGPSSKSRDSTSAPQSNTETLNRGEAGRDAAKQRSAQPYPPPDDESAATGIGRSVRNDVQWIRMDLEPRPVGEVTIRYEYRAALVRLGIIPRDNSKPAVLDRRERAQGFDPKYCPEP